MLFPPKQVRRLLVAAGGEYRPGDRLKRYWMTLCEDLVIHTDTRVEPRTLEDAWQRGILSKRVKAALEELVDKKRQAKAKGHDTEFIAGVRSWIKWAKENDQLFPQHELALLSAFSVFLDRIAVARATVDDQLDRIARCKSRIELTQAYARSNEAAE